MAPVGRTPRPWKVWNGPDPDTFTTSSRGRRQPLAVRWRRGQIPAEGRQPARAAQGWTNHHDDPEEPTMSSTNESIATLSRALDQVGDVLAAVRDDQLSDPTPCEDWDVAHL